MQFVYHRTVIEISGSQSWALKSAGFISLQVVNCIHLLSQV